MWYLLKFQIGIALDMTNKSDTAFKSKVISFLWPLRLGGCWLVVYIRRLIYKILNVCALDTRLLRGVGRLGP